MTDEQIAEEYDLLLSKETDASERTFDSVEPTWNDKVLAALAAARAEQHAECVRLLRQRAQELRDMGSRTWDWVNDDADWLE